jgi:hypothetical protein
MITLYSYPELYGVADNNPYGLKVFAFLKLCNLAFRHEHILDAKAAPRGQLPYIVDGGETIGDSDTIVAHLIGKYRLPIDNTLTAQQRDTAHLIGRMLDDLYWVMSYSRWRDLEFWPLFRDEILRTHPSVSEAGLDQARKYNVERYHYQRHRALRAGRCLRAWNCGFSGPGESRSAGRISLRRATEQHRRRYLWLHRQHSFLRDRHAAQEIRRVTT